MEQPSFKRNLFSVCSCRCDRTKVREEGRVRAKGVMIGIDINTDGYREIVVLMLGDTESEAS